MYLTHFQLQKAPFTITPDPGFVYLSPQHEEALAHLLYGAQQEGSGGFVVLTGEVGTGKTTLCRLLIEQLPESTHVALILNPLLTPLQLLAAICDELGINYTTRQRNQKDLVDLLNKSLIQSHAEGKNMLVLLDEAQNLSDTTLEQVRLLTNLETPSRKLLQIILLGQPELKEKLGKSNLRQLNQRITARFHLKPLAEQDTSAYIRHRLAVAGSRAELFDAAALRAIYRASAGIPRKINILAERCLLGAYALDSDQVNTKVCKAAISEVGATTVKAKSPALKPLIVMFLLAATVALFYWLDRVQDDDYLGETTGPLPVTELAVRLKQPSAMLVNAGRLWDLDLPGAISLCR